jgi:hypothetical protein
LKGGGPIVSFGKSLPDSNAVNARNVLQMNSSLRNWVGILEEGRKMKRATLITVLAVTFSATAAFGQQSSRADFEDYLKAWEGRWVGEFTWVTDWPGMGKRGDRVTAYAECKVIADGNALSGTFYGGNGSSNWITVFDAATKQIKGLSVNSGGNAWNSVFFKNGDSWSCIETGSKADGAKIESKLTITVSDNGNTHVWTGSVTVGGKKVDEVHNVWRRVSK